MTDIIIIFELTVDVN